MTDGVEVGAEYGRDGCLMGARWLCGGRRGDGVCDEVVADVKRGRDVVVVVDGNLVGAGTGLLRGTLDYGVGEWRIRGKAQFGRTVC